jgi:UDP:flavonoid glycosyltransferase YjiC (YdhE family)
VLAAAISQAVNDKTIAQGAATIGEKLRAEDGIANAVRFIEQVSLP